MMKSVKGIFDEGEVKLLETVPAGTRGKVIITFLESTEIDLPERGIDQAQAEELRNKFSTFIEDWERPEMDAYDQLDSPR